MLIDTIAQNFGIDINHYVEIDFTGFQRLVAAVGGVPIYLDTQYRDPHAGLEPIGPGCVTLDGPTALEFARSRRLQYRDADGDWQSDPSGDLGRIGRQQLFIRKALEQVFDLNPFTSPGTLVRLLDVAVDSVKVDAGLSTDDLRSLAERFRSFDPSGIENYSVTVGDERGPGGAAWLRVVDDANTQATINTFRGLPPGTVTPGQVTVQVQNGTGVQRQAADTAEALTAVGFTAEILGDAEEQPAATTVRYVPGSEESARLVARHLTSKAGYEVDPDLDAGVVRLVTGPDFSTVIRTPWPEDAVLAPTTTTSTTAPGAGGTGTTPTTEPSTTTSTTVIGVIPEEPPRRHRVLTRAVALVASPSSSSGAATAWWWWRRRRGRQRAEPATPGGPHRNLGPRRRSRGRGRHVPEHHDASCRRPRHLHRPPRRRRPARPRRHRVRRGRLVRRRDRRTLTQSRVAFLAAVSLLALVGGCGDDQEVVAEAEAGIAAMLAERLDAPVTAIAVACPRDLAVEPGRTFTCDVTVDSGVAGGRRGVDRARRRRQRDDRAAASGHPDRRSA